MAFPTIPTTGNGRMATPIFQANTTATRTFPSLTGLTKNAGDLLVAVIVAYQASVNNATFGSWTGGFAELADVGTTANMAVGIATKVSDGTETGAITCTQAATVTGHVGMFMFSIAGWHGTTMPEVGTIAVGTTAIADPGAFNPTGWDAEDTLWISICGTGELNTTSGWAGDAATAPANYTDMVETGESADITGAIAAAIAFRQNAVASEDVPAWGSVDTSNARNCALVVAVRPISIQTLTPSVISSTFTLNQPTLIYDQTLTPGTISATFTMLQPNISSVPARSFNGSTDRINLAVGGLSGMTYGTVAALVKANNVADFRTLFAFLSGADGYIATPIQVTDTDVHQWHNGTAGVTWAAWPMDVWVLVVVRKATGTTTPRRSYYRFDTQTWVHGNASGTIADWPTPGGSAVVSTSTGSNLETWDGLVGIVAAWSNAVHWSADAAGDSALQAAGLETALQNWIDEAPDALCPFNQAAVTTAIVDIVGASDQSLRTGTSVVIDSPGGFDWTTFVTPGTISTSASLQQPTVILYVKGTLSGGEVRSIDFPGVSGSRFTTPATTDLDVTDGIIVEADVEIPGTSTSQEIVAAHWVDSGGANEAWICYLNCGVANGNKLLFGWRNSTTSTNYFPSANGDSLITGRRTYRWDLNAATGTTNFYRADFWGGSYTSIGSVLNVVGELDTAPTAALSMGERASGTGWLLTGTLYRLRVSKRDGTVLSYWDSEHIRPGTTTFIDANSRTWTLNNSITQERDNVESTSTIQGVVETFLTPATISAGATSLQPVVEGGGLTLTPAAISTTATLQQPTINSIITFDGGNTYLSLPGIKSADATTPHIAAYDVTDGIVIEFEIDIASLPGVDTITPVSIWTDTGDNSQQSWITYIRGSDARIQIGWRNSTTSTNFFPSSSINCLVTGRKTYKLQINATTGASAFWRADTWGGSYTAFGTGSSTAGALAVATMTTLLKVGGAGTGTGNPLTGKVYHVRVSKLDATVLAEWDSTNLASMISADTFVDDQDHVWSVNNEAFIEPNGVIIASSTLNFYSPGIWFPGGAVEIGAVEWLLAVSGEQNITPSTISTITSLQQPTITTGSVTVSPSAISATTSLLQPTIQAGVSTLTPDAISISATLQSVTVIVGEVTLTPGVISTVATLQQPLIETAGFINTDVIVSTATLFAPTLSIFVTPGVISTSATLQAPTLSIFVTPNAISISATVPQPTITVGSVTVTPSIIGITTTLYQPSVAEEGALQVTPSAIDATATLPQPTLITGSVTVTVGLISVSAQMLAPTVLAITAVTPQLLAAPSQLFAPTITTGEVIITLVAISTSPQLLVPLIINLASDPYPVAIAYTDFDYTVEVTSPSYEISSAEASGALEFTTTSNTVEYISDYTVSAGTASYNIEFTEGG